MKTLVTHFVNSAENGKDADILPDTKRSRTVHKEFYDRVKDAGYRSPSRDVHMPSPSTPKAQTLLLSIGGCYDYHDGFSGTTPSVRAKDQRVSEFQARVYTFSFTAAGTPRKEKTKLVVLQYFI